MLLTYNVELIDDHGGGRFRATMNYDELKSYFTKRGFLSDPKTSIIHHLDGNITIDAWDKKNHHILGTATKLQPSHAPFD